MILGRVAYLGSLSRRSAVMTAGKETLRVSVPVSVSRSMVQFCIQIVKPVSVKM